MKLSFTNLKYNNIVKNVRGSDWPTELAIIDRNVKFQKYTAPFQCYVIVLDNKNVFQRERKEACR